MIKINKKTKIRQSTRLLILGEKKTIRFEDIEITQTVYTMKEVIKSKKKYDRKRKNIVLEIDDLETKNKPKITRFTKKTINGRRKRGWKRKGAPEPEVYEPESEPEIERMIEIPKL